MEKGCRPDQGKNQIEPETILHLIHRMEQSNQSRHIIGKRHVLTDAHLIDISASGDNVSDSKVIRLIRKQIFTHKGCITCKYYQKKSKSGAQHPDPPAFSC